MLRYLRLYAHFLRFSFSRALEFRFDFWFRIVMDSVFYIVNLGFFGVLYGHVDRIGGWDRDQAMVFVAGYLFVDAVHMTVFSNSTWWFPILVNRGDLDYYLLRPVSSLFFISLRDFAANSFVNLLIAGGILSWALARHPAPLGAGPIALYVGLLLAGTFIFYCVYMLFLIPVFWTHSVDGLRTLYFGANELSERPHMVYPTWLRRILLSLFPAAMISSYPAWILFQGATPARLLHVAAVACGAFGVMLVAWSRGLRAYSSASS